MIGEYEKISGAEIDQCADVKTETEVGDYADKMRGEDQENELIKANRFLPFYWGMLIP